MCYLLFLFSAVPGKQNLLKCSEESLCVVFLSIKSSVTVPLCSVPLSPTNTMIRRRSVTLFSLSRKTNDGEEEECPRGGKINSRGRIKCWESGRRCRRRLQWNIAALINTSDQIQALFLRHRDSEGPWPGATTSGRLLPLWSNQVKHSAVKFENWV